MAKRSMPPSLQALIPGGGIEAGLQQRFALQGRADTARQKDDLDAQTFAAAHPTQGLHPLPDGNVGSQWDPFLQAVQESGATIGAKGQDALPGLPTDMTGIHAASLDGLDSIKHGRALQLQQMDQASARQNALANPVDSGTGLDRSTNTAVAQLRAAQKLRGY